MKCCLFPLMRFRRGLAVMGVLSALLCYGATVSRAQMAAPSLRWQKCLGGSDNDRARSIIQTSDGGFAIAGWTKSTDSEASGNHGGYDAMVVRLDSNGLVVWRKCYGGPGFDEAYSIVQTPDSGFAFAGVASNNGGDVAGNHGNTDVWVVKLDRNGSITWQKCFGGTDAEAANCIINVKDGGFAVAGYTRSVDSDVIGNHGLDDAWILRLDGSGNLIEQRCLGGTYIDQANSIIQTDDGGFIIAGQTNSNDSDVSGLHGAVDVEPDAWIVRLAQDITEKVQWQRCYGGTKLDIATSIVETKSHELVFAGYSVSNDSDLLGVHSYSSPADYWVVELDPFGNIVWNRCYGGSFDDEPFSIVNTADSGLAVAGYTNSDDSDVVGDHPSQISPNSWDFWLVKLGANGALQWQKCLGGTGEEAAACVVQCSNGGFALAGYTHPDSTHDEDVSGAIWQDDMWVVRLDSAGGAVGAVSPRRISQNNSISTYPNPFTKSTTIQFTSPESGYVTVTIVNTLGVEVARVFAGEVGAGEHSLPWNIPAGLPAGMYECVVRMGSGTNEIPVLHSP